MRFIPAVLILFLCAPVIDGYPEQKTYQVVGKILRSDGQPFGDGAPMMFLHGAVTPFVAKALAGPDGQFRFKNIPAGAYTLIAALPRIGETRKTVEVGPSFADSKGRVTVTFEIDGKSMIREQVVSAIELSVPEAARQAYSKAHDDVARRDIEGAIAQLKKAVEIAPQYAAAWNQLGTIAYQSQQYPQAEAYFREALKQDPSAYSPLVNLGGALMAQNKVEESLPVNLEAVKAMPGDALAHSQLGSSYFFLGQLDEAEIQLKEAKAIDPAHFSFPQLILAEIYARKKQPEAAAAEIREFIKLHPDSEWTPKLRKALETLAVP
jgi:tetratricopeptide (TPR) repeat protein